MCPLKYKTSAKWLLDFKRTTTVSYQPTNQHGREIIVYLHQCHHLQRVLKLWLSFLLVYIKMSQLIRLWYLSHRRPANAQASLRIRAFSPEPSLFAHMNYGSRRRVKLKIRHLAPLDGCTCVFEEWIYGGQKVPKSHELAQTFSITGK